MAFTDEMTVYEGENFIVIDGSLWGMPDYYYQIGSGVYDDPVGPFDTVQEAIEAAQDNLNS